MKKQHIKNLNLNRKTISKLGELNKIQAGAKYSTDCWTDILTSVFIACPDPEPIPPTVFPGDVCPL